MKIDIFPHISPPKYNEALIKVGSHHPHVRERPSLAKTPLCDVDKRFEIMDRFEGLVQVLTMAEPPIEQVADSAQAVDLAQRANDELAELVSRYTDRFIAAAATLPLNNMDAALKEIDRAINDLKLKGIQIYSPINDKSIDSPEFLPLYEKMSQYNLPIWIHPTRRLEYPDYKTEEQSLYYIFALLGWPYETTTAMARLAYSGVLEKYPNLKIITHHCGGTIPYLAGRIAELGGDRVVGAGKYAPLTKTLAEYLMMFYADTATYARVPALMCGYDFFGAEHILFGTDMPFGTSEQGAGSTRISLRGISQMDISDQEKELIYEGNARRLLCLA